MKDWIEKRIKECNANNVIIFPLRPQDIERRLKNAKELRKLKEDTLKKEKDTK